MQVHVFSLLFLGDWVSYAFMLSQWPGTELLLLRWSASQMMWSESVRRMHPLLTFSYYSHLWRALPAFERQKNSLKVCLWYKNVISYWDARALLSWDIHERMALEDSWSENIDLLSAHWVILLQIWSWSLTLHWLLRIGNHSIMVLSQ